MPFFNLPVLSTLGNNQPSVVTPSAFNLQTGTGSTFQITAPDVTIPASLQSLAAGAPIQVIKSNNGFALLGAAAFVTALYFVTK